MQCLINAAVCVTYIHNLMQKQYKSKLMNKKSLTEFDEAEIFGVTIINASCIKSKEICIVDD